MDSILCVCMSRQEEPWLISWMSDQDPAQRCWWSSRITHPKIVFPLQVLSLWEAWKKVAYLGKVGGMVPSTCFFHSDRRRGIVTCHRLKPAFLSSVSKWKFCSFQGNIIGWHLWTHCSNSARWEAWKHTKAQNLAARRSIRNWQWNLSWTSPARNQICGAQLWGDAKPTAEY